MTLSLGWGEFVDVINEHTSQYALIPFPNRCVNSFLDVCEIEVYEGATGYVVK